MELFVSMVGPVEAGVHDTSWISSQEQAAAPTKEEKEGPGEVLS